MYFTAIPGATACFAMGLAEYVRDKSKYFVNNVLASCRTSYFLFAILTIALAAILLLGIIVFQWQPVVDDEEAYLFQARTLILGHLVQSPPPVPDLLKTAFMIVNPVWTGKYLFGHPAILATGIMLGSAYIATIALALASIVLLYVIGSRCHGPAVAKCAAVFMSLSPWFWFTSATLMSHATMLFLLLLGLLFTIRLGERPSLVFGFFLGVCCGWAFTVRPLTLVCFAAPICVGSLPALFSDRRKHLPSLVGFFLGLGLIALMVAEYNRLVTGDMLTFPFLHYDPRERLGFGPRLSGEHTPLTALKNLCFSLSQINVWAAGSTCLLPVLVACLFLNRSGSMPNSARPDDVPRVGRRDKYTSLWIAICLTMFVGYAFYYNFGVQMTGPIYYYELLIPLSFLTSKAVVALWTFDQTMPAKPGVKGLSAFLLVTFLISVGLFVPLKGLAIARAYHPGRSIYAWIESQVQGKSVVLVSGAMPVQGVKFSLPYPSPDLNNPVLYARAKGCEDVQRLFHAFPDRQFWHLYLDTRNQRVTIEAVNPEDCKMNK
jgi:hypothetical protein